MRNRKETTEFFIHCSATKPDQDFDVEDIRRWHTDPKPKGNGWSRVGYHWVIPRAGGLQVGLPIDKIGIHAKGHNSNSIAVCMIGGLDDEGNPAPFFTLEQWRDLEILVDYVKKIYPGIAIRGHNEVSTKACPSFDVQAYLACSL